MIQAADVGVGISGEEGLQAVNSSDYAIAQVCSRSCPWLFAESNVLRLVPVLEAVVTCSRPLVVCTQRKHDRQLLLQELGLYWCSLVVPDLLRVEQSIVSLVFPLLGT